MIGRCKMLNIITIAIVLIATTVNVYIMVKGKRKIEQKESESDKEMREHINAMMNYTPEIAYRKVKHD